MKQQQHHRQQPDRTAAPARKQTAIVRPHAAVGESNSSAALPPRMIYVQLDATAAAAGPDQPPAPASAAPTAARLRGPLRFRTRMCDTHALDGTCDFGARCAFAHSREDLRTVAQNEADGLTTDRDVALFAAQQARAPPPPVAQDRTSSQTTLPLRDASTRPHGRPLDPHSQPLPVVGFAPPPPLVPEEYPNPHHHHHAAAPQWQWCSQHHPTQQAPGAGCYPPPPPSSPPPLLPPSSHFAGSLHQHHHHHQHHQTFPVELPLPPQRAHHECHYHHQQHALPLPPPPMPIPPPLPSPMLLPAPPTLLHFQHHHYHQGLPPLEPGTFSAATPFHHELHPLM